MRIEHQDIVGMIRSSSDQRQAAIRLLANDGKLKADIIRYVASHHGNDDDGLMVFHDSILTFVKKMFTDRDFVLDTTHAGYIFGIAKYVWSNMLKKKSKAPLSISLDAEGISSIIPAAADERPDTERAATLQTLLTKLKPKCKEVLMYWSGGYSMKEIATLVGYSSEGMARKKKCECYKELVVWLEAHPTFKNALKNKD